MKTALNGILELVRSVKRGISTISTDGLFGGSSIPGYASGGVVTKPTYAMVGEYAGAKSNPEIITPEDKMRQVFNEGNSALANIYVQVGRQIISAIENQNLSVQIGDEQIARSAGRGNRDYYNRTGSQLLTV